MTEYTMNTLSEEGIYLKEDDEKLTFNDIKTSNNQNTIKTSNIKDKNINLIENKNNQIENDNSLSINEKEEKLPPKIIDKIICGSRRRKYPNGIKNMGGYFLTIFLFLFFTIVLTISVNSSKKLLDLSNKTIIIFNTMLVIIWITTIISLIILTDAATSDPGRQRGTPISKNKYLNSKIKSVVNGKKFVLKYCDTCKLIRDVRSFHCKYCGLCVERHDHHCGYLSNCVGIGNYHKFYIFVLTSFIHVLIILCFSAYFMTEYNKQMEKGKVLIMVSMAIVTIYGGIFTIYLFGLFGEHTMQALKNKLTREAIKKKEHPEFDRGYKNNWREAIKNKFPIYDIHNYFQE